MDGNQRVAMGNFSWIAKFRIITRQQIEAFSAYTLRSGSFFRNLHTAIQLLGGNFD